MGDRQSIINEVLNARSGGVNETTQHASFVERLLKTRLDMTGELIQSALKGLEGIYDAGATVVGGVGGIFDKEFQNDVQKHIATDYTGGLLAHQQRYFQRESFIPELGVAEKYVRGVAQGVGQMLPSLAMNLVLPGSGLITMGVSAGGNAMEKASQDGATYGKAATYAVLSGAVEILTEKLFGGATSNITGKGLLDSVMKSVGKTSLWKSAIKMFGEEAVEEMLATFVEPSLRSVYQEGAYKETFTQKQLEQVLQDGIVGGLTGIVYGNTLGKIKNTSMDVGETVGEIQSVDRKINKLWESDNLTEDAQLELGSQREVYQADLNKKLSKLAESKRKEIVQKYGIELNDNGTVKTYERDATFNQKAYSAQDYGKEQTFAYAPINAAQEVPENGKAIIKYHSELNKLSRAKTSIVLTTELGVQPNGKKNMAAFVNNRIYVDPTATALDVAKAKIVHETTHSLERLDALVDVGEQAKETSYKKLKRTLLNALKENADVKKALDPDGALWARTVILYQKQLEGKTKLEQEWIVSTEIVAQMSEVLFTDEKVIRRLTQENRSFVQKVYNYIKNLIEYYRSRKGKTDSEKEYLAFLHTAENLYKMALEESAGGVNLKTVRQLAEIVEPASKEEPRLSIETLPNGQKYVKADGLTFSQDKSKWSDDLYSYLYHGILQDKPEIQIPDTNGDMLTLTYKLMGKLSTRSTNEPDYEIKARATAQLDEIVKASRPQINPDGTIKVKPDIANRHLDRGDFAKDGWEYRNSNFMDTNGEYYLVRMSVARKDGAKYIYNIGDVIKETTPSAIRLSETGIASDTSISQDNADVNTENENNPRFSIFDAKNLKEYKETEVAEALTDILAEKLQFGMQYGELSKQAERELVNILLTEIKHSTDVNETAKKIADFVVDRATIESGIDDSAVEEDYNLYNVLKGFKNTMNLDGIRDDIKHTYGNDNSPFMRWGKRKGTQGRTADSIGKELASSGIQIQAINEANIFVEIDDMFLNVSKKINKHIEATKKTIAESENGSRIAEIKSTLTAEIVKMIQAKGKPTTANKVLKSTLAELKTMEAKIAEAENKISEMKSAVDATSEDKQKQIASLMEEIRVLHNQYNRMKLEQGEDSEQIKRLAELLKMARKDVSAMHDKLVDANQRARAINYLFERVERVKDLEKYAGAGVELGAEVIGLIKMLKNVKTWRGNISSKVRDVMQTYARISPEGTKLYNLIMNEGGAENPKASAIEEIAIGKGELTTDEIRDLSDILDNFVHSVREYDNTFMEGKKQSTADLVSKGLLETAKTVPMSNGLWAKFKRWLEAPLWRFTRLSNYDDEGLMSRLFWNFQAGLNKQEAFNMKAAKHFEAWFKAHTKEANTWHNKTTFQGIEMSRGQMMSLYLLSLRVQAAGHIFNKTESIVLPDGTMSFNRKGVVRIIDDKLAMKSLKEAQTVGKDVEISDKLIADLKAQFTQSEKDFMNLVHQFFNTISADAKRETDIATIGISSMLERNYFPIRVANDQIYRNLAEDTAFQSLFAVTNASFNKKLTKNANNNIVIENIMDVVNRHSRQMGAYYGLAVPVKAFNRIWNTQVNKSSLKKAVGMIDPFFEEYVGQLLKDVQGQNPQKEGAAKFLAVVRGWGAKAALGLNPKVWANQMVSLFAAHGVGFKYELLMKGLGKAMQGKTDFAKLMELSPMMYARFREGMNIDTGRLREDAGMSGKLNKLTEWTLAPITWMDKMMIGSIWNAALEQTGNEEDAAKMVEKAVIVTQANYTSLYRPAILRSRDSFVQLSTMFMSEPLQVFSQLFGSIDKLMVARKTGDAKLIEKAKRESKQAFTSITLDMLLLASIAQAFKWIKDKDDEELNIEGFMKEMVGNVMGMFPVVRDLMSLIDGYDVSNMAYTGLTNIYTAGREMYDGAAAIINGDPEDTVATNASIRKVIIGIAQTLGVPLRNLETYLKGITEKLWPSGVETYESWFYKKTTAYYTDALNKAFKDGNDNLADTLISLMIKSKLDITSEKVKAETKRLYLRGMDALPQAANTSFSHKGETVELSGKEYKQFVETYSKAEKSVKALVSSTGYMRLTDEIKTSAMRIIYDYYYNLAKSELLGEDLDEKLTDLVKTIPMSDLAIILAGAREYKADKDEEGKPIAGTKKLKVMQLLKGLTASQQAAVMDYLGYVS